MIAKERERRPNVDSVPPRPRPTVTPIYGDDEPWRPVHFLAGLAWLTVAFLSVVLALGGTSLTYEAWAVIVFWAVIALLASYRAENPPIKGD